MTELIINTCPITLAEGFHTYSPLGLKQLFSGKKTAHILPYHSHQPNQTSQMAELMENRKRISISGVQEKLSLIWDKGQLRLTRQGEQGTYILKPIPRDLENVDQVPANEHLTMQIAKQIYKLNVAESALIFFENGEPAYLTKRFDIDSKTSKKLGKEDFATLALKSKETDGEEFKYNYSYEGIALLIKKYVAAYPIAIEEFFRLVVFNFLFSNGDAHLKNFALLETSQGDYNLSPAYDLVNTRLHVKDSEMALKDGLFAEDYYTKSYEAMGLYAYDDFFEFGIKIGIMQIRVKKILNEFSKPLEEIEPIINRSFLSDEMKERYKKSYESRLGFLRNSYAKRDL
ncbi:HipA domain-containing protein [Algoriphagus sp. NBT04N3]|jgi:serine/threonine-protein kinase HipA|uniref:type II toxin-antitoxin system HipA family toxin n=1 Tax=Algoriphagus sp. NBT04N3 TaxID=2705473 RepID=UPI001C632758|nr:HipA domain-containing protein [Algoriphagus sp. NBT04N3]QYH37654.1 HipA domain-containing protein [Algoriphagus sp. NBT04N3]